MKRKMLLMMLFGFFILSDIFIVIFFIGCNVNTLSTQEPVSPQLNDCIVSHIIQNNPDILEDFAKKGWDKSQANWRNIVVEWGRINPDIYKSEIIVFGQSCQDADIDCNPQPFDNATLNDIAKKLNNIDTWNQFCCDNNWYNPLIDHHRYPEGEMPCMTWVSTIWYLSGIKLMDVPGDGYSWYVNRNNPGGCSDASPGSASNSWTNGGNFYKYISMYYAPYYPKMLDSNLGGDIGIQIKTYETNTSLIDSNVQLVNDNLKVGDILQYKGSLNGDYYYKHSVLVVEAKPGTTAKIASFGSPRGYGIRWDINIPFSYDYVRVIHIPGTDYIYNQLPMQRNLILNSSFEVGDNSEMNWIATKNDVSYDYYDTNSSKSNYGARYLIFNGSGKYNVYRKDVLLARGASYKIGLYIQNGVFYEKDIFDQIGYIYLKNLVTDETVFTSNISTTESLPYDKWTLITVDCNYKIGYDGKWEIGLYLKTGLNNWCYIDDFHMYMSDYLR